MPISQRKGNENNCPIITQIFTLIGYMLQNYAR